MAYTGRSHIFGEEFYRQPPTPPTNKWGQYGSMENTPTDVLEYLLRQLESDLREHIEKEVAELESIKQEIQKRQIAIEESWSLERRIVEIGYREYAKQNHPDHGGKEVDMDRFRRARSRLDEILKELEK